MLKQNRSDKTSAYTPTAVPSTGENGFLFIHFCIPLRCGFSKRLVAYRDRRTVSTVRFRRNEYNSGSNFYFFRPCFNGSNCVLETQVVKTTRRTTPPRLAWEIREKIVPDTWQTEHANVLTRGTSTGTGQYGTLLVNSNAIPFVHVTHANRPRTGPISAFFATRKPCPALPFTFSTSRMRQVAPSGRPRTSGSFFVVAKSHLVQRCPRDGYSRTNIIRNHRA